MNISSDFDVFISVVFERTEESKISYDLSSQIYSHQNTPWWLQEASLVGVQVVQEKAQGYQLLKSWGGKEGTAHGAAIPWFLGTWCLARQWGRVEPKRGAAASSHPQQFLFLAAYPSLPIAWTLKRRTILRPHRLKRMSHWLFEAPSSCSIVWPWKVMLLSRTFHCLCDLWNTHGWHLLSTKLVSHNACIVGSMRGMLFAWKAMLALYLQVPEED